MANNLNSNAGIKRYGKSKNSLTSSYPSNSNFQSSSLFMSSSNSGLSPPNTKLTDENSYTRLTQSYNDDSLLKRKNTDDEHKSLKNRKKLDLSELIGQGDIDDITLLNNSIKSMTLFKSFNVSLPDRYNDEQRIRCDKWLKEILGFEEKVLGNSVVYRHPKWKVEEFRNALSKLSSKLNITFGTSPSKSHFQNNQTSFIQAQEQNQSSHHFSISSSSSITAATTAINREKFHLRLVHNDDDDDALDHGESPALFPNMSSFSPSPVPNHSSSFFSTSIDHNNKGARQLPSPLEGLGHFLEKGLKLGNSFDSTTSGIRSNNRTRSRAFSNEDIGANRSRAASRAEPAILEGRCEDTEEEEELTLMQPDQLLVDFTNVTSTINNNIVAPTPVYSTAAFIPPVHSKSINLIHSTQTTTEMEDTQPTVINDTDEGDFSDASTVLDESFSEDKLENDASLSSGNNAVGTNMFGIASMVPNSHSHSSNALPPTSFHPSSHISPHLPSLSKPNKTNFASSPANLVNMDRIVRKTKPIMRAQTEPLFVSHHQMSPGNDASYSTTLHPIGSKDVYNIQTPVASRPLDCACNYLWESSEPTSETSIRYLLEKFNNLMLCHEEAPRIKRSISDPYSISSYVLSQHHPHIGQGFMQISPHLDQGVSVSVDSNFFTSNLHSNQFEFKNPHSFGSILPRSSQVNDFFEESPTTTALNIAVRHRMSQSTGSIIGSFGLETSHHHIDVSSPHIYASSSLNNNKNVAIGEVPIFQHSEILKSADKLMTHSGSVNEPTFESVRMQRKKIKSQAKLRRMSVCVRPICPINNNNDIHIPQHILPTIAETKQHHSNNSFSSFSPEPIAKCSKFRNQRRKSTLFAQNNSGFINIAMNMDDSQNHSHSGIDFDLSFNVHDNSILASTSNSAMKPHIIKNPNLYSPIALKELNESNFKGIIIGGVYQHCFDGPHPLVAAPAASDKRVVDVKIKDDSSLVLSLYLPKDKTTKQIDLGVHWQWMRCSPTGYLAFRQSQLNSLHVYYYLPKHPEDWEEIEPSSQHQHHVYVKQQSLTRQQKRASIIPSHEYKGGLTKFNDIPEESILTIASKQATAQIDIEMDCQLFVAAVETSPSLLHPIKHSDGEDVDDYYIMSHGDSYDDLNLSSNHIDIDNNLDNHIHHRNEDLIINSSSEYWCNPNIMSLILDFLIDDISLVGSIHALEIQLANIQESNSSTSTKTRRKANTTNKSELYDNIRNSLLSAKQLISYQSVNKAWALGIYIVIANRKSLLIKNNNLSFNYDRYVSFINKFKDGKFLSQGACKDVYCIKNPNNQSLEAISVMDINDLIERGMDNAITQELQISLLCSSLITLNICPNLVQVYSLFQSNYNAPKNLWKVNKSIQDVKNSSVNKVTIAMLPREKDIGKYQFIRMEFCTGGDVEELVRKVHTLDPNTVRSYLFQMCYSLYACREKLCLRHFDIKLLNFFVTDSASLLQQSNEKENMACDSNISLQYGVGNHIYKIPIHTNTLSLIKLADFGTSYVGAAGLGDFITMQQFTTLENTPPEFLLLGSRARQSYSSDTFPLGLCFLHMLTGYEPYEELLKDIHCPNYLANKLRNLWLTTDPNNQYYLLYEVIQSLDSDSYEQLNQTTSSSISSLEENIMKGPEMILIDTLYRYLVLFGASEDIISETSALHSLYHQSSPAWNIIIEALDVKNVIISNYNKVNNKHNKSNYSCNDVPIWNAGRGKANQKQTTDHHQCIYQYKQDLSLWSIHKGKHKVMIGLRDRLALLGNDASKLLDSLLHFDPSRRSTMYDALLHPMFTLLRDPLIEDSNGNKTKMRSLAYMHYYRPSQSSNHHTSLYQSNHDLPIL